MNKIKCEECDGTGYVETYSLEEAQIDSNKYFKVGNLEAVDLSPIHEVTKEEARRIVNQKEEKIYEEILKILREKAEEDTCEHYTVHLTTDGEENHKTETCVKCGEEISYYKANE